MGAREVSQVLGVPLLATMRGDSSVSRDLEDGLAGRKSLRRPLVRAAGAVLQALVPATAAQ
jgi:hypothetical protein